jgi:predicted transcriptional regulator
MTITTIKVTVSLSKALSKLASRHRLTKSQVVALSVERFSHHCLRRTNDNLSPLDAWNRGRKYAIAKRKAANRKRLGVKCKVKKALKARGMQ